MIRSVLLSIVRGFVMGAADIVPGVSGGTIALIFGIYERLIASIRAGSLALGNLLKMDMSGFKKWMREVDWAFIIPLGAGILIAVFSLAHVLERLLVEQAVMMAALFVGLVAGSIVVAWGLIRTQETRHFSIAIGVGVAVFVVLGLRSGTSEETVGQILDPQLWAFFLAGALAITAMILPGISGSFILVLLGMYGPLLNAVTTRDLLALGVFTIGAIVGLALFSQVLHRALTLHHDNVIAALVGLMAGSLRVLWPWPSGVDSTALGVPDSHLLAAFAVAIAAFGAVVIISRFAQRLEAEDHPASAAA
jgi:putative membrane protein